MTISVYIGSSPPAGSKRTLLQMIQDACSELGLVAPTTVFSNSDQQIIQLLALAQREGMETYSMGTAIGGWQELRQEYAFNVQSTGLVPVNIVSGSNIIEFVTAPAVAPQVGWVISNSAGSNATGFLYPTTVTAIVDSTHVTVSQASTITASNTNLAIGQDTYDFPTDVDHTIPQTFWDRSFRWQILGPLDPQEWQVLKSGISPTGPRRRFRIFGGKFVIDPVPYDTNRLVYEYYSTYWCQSDAGAGQMRWMADSDVYNLNDQTFIMGLIWRFRRAKGLDYAQEYQNWQNAIDRYKARQAAARSLPLNATASGIRLLNSNNVPDTGFGS